MDPITMALAAGLPAVMSLIGELAASGDDAAAEQLRQQAMEQYNIDIPEVQEVSAQAISSQAAGAQGSQEAKGARMQALRELQRRASEGYTDEDRAAVNDTMMDIETNARGAREAALRNVNPNSGAAIQARLSNAQNAAQMANRRGLDIAGQSRRAALQAIAQTGQLGGAIDESEFGQAFQRGGAQDAISRFNEANRMDAARQNAAMLQQQFQNRMGLADARSDAMRSRAGDKERTGGRKRNLFRGLGGSAQQGFGEYAKYKMK